MKKSIHLIKYVVLIILLVVPCGGVEAQDVFTDTIHKPSVLYSAPKRYEIAGITVSGIDNYEDYVLIGLSGLSVGQVITVPGDEITNAIKRYWKHGLFSNVSITIEKVVGNQAYLNIALTQRPRLSKVNYNGVKKSEMEDLEAKLGFREGNQITPNMIDRAKIVVKRYYDEKGFKNAEINIMQRDDITEANSLILDINVDKKYVDEHLVDISKKFDLGKYIL
jgi:outer membrane protein insertion porin family